MWRSSRAHAISVGHCVLRASTSECSKVGPTTRFAFKTTWKHNHQHGSIPNIPQVMFYHLGKTRFANPLVRLYGLLQSRGPGGSHEDFRTSGGIGGPGVPCEVPKLRIFLFNILFTERSRFFACPHYRMTFEVYARDPSYRLCAWVELWSTRAPNVYSQYCVCKGSRCVLSPAVGREDFSDPLSTLEGTIGERRLSENWEATAYKRTRPICLGAVSRISAASTCTSLFKGGSFRASHNTSHGRCISPWLPKRFRQVSIVHAYFKSSLLVWSAFASLVSGLL